MPNNDNQFSFNFERKINDIPKEIKIAIPDTKSPALIPAVKNPVLGYNLYPSGGRNVFNPPEYDLSEIGKITDVESYVARAFDKKVALMFKEGWDFVGKNPRTLKYIRTRFEQIASASSIPTGLLFRSIGSGLISKSNVFLMKVRNIEASGGKEREVFGTSKTLDPIAAYFVAPAETMEYELINNRVTRWQQNMPNGTKVPYSVDNIVHFFFNKKDGFVYGTPTLTPVIDDIRALRKIEENVELLVYQHLFPLFQWIVGTDERPATFTEDGKREVDIVKDEVRGMPSEGAIVTTERHKIAAIGAEGRALRAENYLTHFKKRVFAGLGISSVDYGEGENGGRATSESMSQNLIDSVKDFQQVMEYFVNELIIKELLLESTFGDDVLDEENKVILKFREIDIAMQIKKEAHYADQFNKYVINLTEARLGAGREPMAVPSNEEIDSGKDDKDQYPDFFMMKWMLFDRPKTLMQSIDEPWSSQAKARTAAETKAADEKKQIETDQDLKAQEIQIKKKALSARRVKNSFSLQDSILAESFKVTQKDLTQYLSEHKQDVSPGWIDQLIRASLTPVTDKLFVDQMNEFRKGYSLHGSTSSDEYIRIVRQVRPKLRSRSEKYIDRLIRDLIKGLNKHIDVQKPFSELTSNMTAVFDSLSYRADFIEEAEYLKAYHLGIAYALKAKGYSSLEVFTKNETCDNCKQHIGEFVDLTHVLVENLPPFHPHCDCGIKGHLIKDVEKI
jgi:hypothetical protein